MSTIIPTKTNINHAIFPRSSWEVANHIFGFTYGQVVFTPLLPSVYTTHLLNTTTHNYLIQHIYMHARTQTHTCTCIHNTRMHTHTHNMRTNTNTHNRVNANAHTQPIKLHEACFDHNVASQYFSHPLA